MNAVSQIALSPKQVIELERQLNENIQPIIRELAKIESMHIPTYILHSDGKFERKDNYTKEQTEAIQYLQQLIQIEYDKLSKSLGYINT